MQLRYQPRLPKSAARGQRGFLRLLTRIDLDAPLGLQFVGQVLTPGAAFDAALLPRPAVLLEYAGRDRIAPYRSRYSFQDLWLVWWFDFAFGAWIEVARTHSEWDVSWTHDIAFLAHRRLCPTGERPVAERAQPVIDAIEAAIRRGLESVNRDAHACVVQAVDAYLASQIVHVSKELTVERIGAATETGYPRIGAEVDHSK